MNPETNCASGAASAAGTSATAAALGLGERVGCLHLGQSIHDDQTEYVHLLCITISDALYILSLRIYIYTYMYMCI